MDEQTVTDCGEAPNACMHLQDLTVDSGHSFGLIVYNAASCLSNSHVRVMCCQVALSSQAVSVSVTDSSRAISLSPLGVLVVPDDVSTVRIRPQHSHLPIFWSLKDSLSGDRVSSSWSLLGREL